MKSKTYHRYASDHDCERVAAIHAFCCPDDAWIAGDFIGFREMGGILRVVECGDEVQGFVAYKRLGSIEAICVMPPFRHRGLASGMLTRILQQAERDHVAVEVDVPSDAPDACKFLRSHGFKASHFTRNGFEVGVDEWTFTRPDGSSKQELTENAGRA